MKEAESHTQQAIAFNQRHGEAFYQLAKIQMSLGRPHEAIPNLRRAAELDPHFTIRAATDLDFLKYETELRTLIDSLRQEAEKMAGPAIGEAKRQLTGLEEWRDEKVFAPEMTVLDGALVAAQRSYGANTFLGYLDARTTGERLAAMVKRLQDEQRRYFSQSVSFTLSSLSQFHTDLMSQAKAFSSPKYREAHELLCQVQREITSHADYARQREILKRAHEALRQSVAEFQVSMGRSKSNARLRGRLLGALIGVLVGVIPMALVALVLAALVALFFWATARDFNAPGSYVRYFNPLQGIFFLIGLIVAGVIGAMIFRRKAPYDHGAFARGLGSMPSLPNLGEFQRPEPVFDETTFAKKKQKRDRAN